MNTNLIIPTLPRLSYPFLTCYVKGWANVFSTPCNCVLLVFITEYLSLFIRNHSVYNCINARNKAPLERPADAAEPSGMNHSCIQTGNVHHLWAVYATCSMLMQITLVPTKWNCSLVMRTVVVGLVPYPLGDWSKVLMYRLDKWIDEVHVVSRLIPYLDFPLMSI